MRLQGIVDGTVYALASRTLYGGPDLASLEKRGAVPTPADRRVIDRLATNGVVRSVVTSLVGEFATARVHPLGEGTLLATTGGQIFVSRDGGHSWRASRPLPPSSPSFGVLPCATCRHDGTIYLGEYPLADDTTPNVLRSSDGGKTWSGVEIPGVRHVHSVAVDPYTDEVWVTTGDRDDECWIGRLRNRGFEPVGGGSQRWRAVELAFTPDSVLWGMDCVYADENEVLRLDRDELDVDVPTPTTVHHLDGSVFYGVTVSVDDTPWVVLSTGALIGRDSTAPSRPSRGRGEAAVVASSAATQFTEWEKLGQYPKRRVLADLFPSSVLASANAYVFLAADGNRLLVNPYNTAAENGRILDVSLEGGAISGV